jgi:flagellar basal-body rod modification protein FlgD
MSFISPIPTDASGAERTTGSMQSLGKDDFLNLLVTKMKYQDPLEPMKDEDFIAQLAQFSSLEQMANISDGIDKSNQWSYLQMQSLNNVMASGFIGKEVKAEYSDLYIDGNNKPVISYTTDQYASEIEFTISDAGGHVVATITEEDVNPGTGSIEWDGKDQRGNRVDEGYYTVEATAVNSSNVEFAPSLSLVGLVTNVVYRDGAAYLTVNGTEVALGDVTSVGEPGFFTDDD